MKGLLIKDFKLLTGQKTFFIAIVLIAIGLSISNSNPSFIIGYMTFVGSLFTLSTINYDEFDNGYAFLFSLPITRKNYVLEKYEFGLIMGSVSWILGMMIAVFSGFTKNAVMIKDTLMNALLMLPIMLIILAIMLPFQFKFGGEKSRIAIIGFVGLQFCIAFIVVEIAGLFDINLISILNNLSAMNMGLLILVALGISIILLLISLKLSISIMKKKEF